MRNIGQNFGLTVWALRRHARRHLPETLSEAARMKEIARADDLVPRLEKAVDVAEEVMDEARGMGAADRAVDLGTRAIEAIFDTLEFERWQCVGNALLSKGLPA